MGFWNVVGREVGRVLRESMQSTSGSPTGSSPPVTPEALRGPDPSTLLTAGEIEEATGGRPVGEGSRKYGDSDNDIGYMRVFEWTLSNDGELLINFTRFRDDDALALWRSRIEDPSWQVDYERPLEGLGELAWAGVTKDPKGGTEIHVSAKQGMYKSSLVHSSRSGAKDTGPLVTLMAKVLSRLEEKS